MIRLQNVGEGLFIKNDAHISHDHYDSLSKHHVRAGDLVIAALGEHLPRACIVPEALGPALVKADCIRFRPNEMLAVSGFLNIALNSELTRARTSSIVHGIGRPRLNLPEIRGICLPIPPLGEQERIVVVAERHLSVLDDMEAAVIVSLRRAERLRQAILRRAFEGKLVPQDPQDEPATVLLDRIKAERNGATHAHARSRGKATRREAYSAVALPPDGAPDGAPMPVSAGANGATTPQQPRLPLLP